MSASAVWRSFVPAWLAPARITDKAAAVDAPRVLLVVPHPDDEYYFAATVYRIAKELGGVVDQVVITDGAGGHGHVHLAERFYGMKLRGERRRLARVRREEVRRAGLILGIRRQHLLNESDECFTLDAEEGLSRIWNRERVVAFLERTLAATPYDYVFTILPTDSTHGHHKSATLLALEAVQRLAPAQRPIVLGAEPVAADESTRVDSLCGVAASAEPVFEFDRRRRTSDGASLAYSIVVNWVIAEHKSQGVFQGDYGRHDVERYWVLGEHMPAQSHALDQLRTQL